MNLKAAHATLLDAARAQTTVSYTDIIHAAGLTLSGDALSGALGRLFYDIVQAELAQNPDAPMLSAIALPKDGNRPSKGFFDLARELGRLGSTLPKDEDAFWVSEMNKVYAYWRSNE